MFRVGTGHMWRQVLRLKNTQWQGFHEFLSNVGRVKLHCTCIEKDESLIVIIHWMQKATPAPKTNLACLRGLVIDPRGLESQQQEQHTKWARTTWSDTT